MKRWFFQEVDLIEATAIGIVLLITFLCIAAITYDATRDRPTRQQTIQNWAALMQVQILSWSCSGSQCDVRTNVGIVPLDCSYRDKCILHRPKKEGPDTVIIPMPMLMPGM